MPRGEGHWATADRTGRTAVHRSRIWLAEFERLPLIAQQLADYRVSKRARFENCRFRSRYCPGSQGVARKPLAPPKSCFGVVGSAFCFWGFLKMWWVIVAFVSAKLLQGVQQQLCRSGIIRPPPFASTCTLLLSSRTTQHRLILAVTRNNSRDRSSRIHAIRSVPALIN